MKRLRTLMPVLALFLVPFLAAGCGPDDSTVGGDAASAASADDSGTSGVASGMLQSQEELRSGASGAAGGPADTVDIANLGFTRGNADAPVRIIEFSDFGCGYCRQFHDEVWPTLEEQYVESGKVEWKHIPMILGIFGKNADEAAEAALCAREQGGFEAVKHRLFADQGDWKRASDPTPVLERFVREEGLEAAEWTRCMASDRFVGEVEAGTALSRQVGVRGTPTFFIVGVAAIPGLVPLETFQQVLDTVYAQATR